MSVSVLENQQNQSRTLFGWYGLKALFVKTKSSGRSAKLSFGALFNADERFNNSLVSTGSPKTYNQSSLTPLIQSILGWLRVFVGMADHSKASNSSNLYDLSANQKLNRKCFGFRHNNKMRFGSSDLEKNTLSSTFQRPSPTHRSNQSSLTPLILGFLAVISPIQAKAVVQWGALNGPAGGAINVIAIDPVTSATIYAGTPLCGIFKSTDNGLNWAAVNTGLTGRQIRSIAINPLTPTTIYAGTLRGGIFKSTDSGLNWAAVNTGLTGMDIQSIAIDPVLPTTIYVGTGGGGIFKSTDGGLNWIAMNTGFPWAMYIKAVTIDPKKTATLYVETRGAGLFKSTDGGLNWNNMNFYSGITTKIVIDPVTPATLYAGTAGGVFKSADGGMNWVAINIGLISKNIQSVVIDSMLPTTLYVGTASGGVFKSLDGGLSWTAVNTRLTDMNVQFIAITPRLPTTLYAGTATKGVFKSTDGGLNWVTANVGLTAIIVRAIAIDPVTPATLYAGTNVGVFKSTNGGFNWATANVGLTAIAVPAIAIDPLIPTTVYAGTTGGSMFKSTDGGLNWTVINTGLNTRYSSISNTRYIQSIAIDPVTPSTLYVGVAGGGIFKSTDGGLNWLAMTQGLNIQSIAIDLTTPTTLYAGSWSSGVFKSTDGGLNWVSVNIGIFLGAIRTIAINPLTPTTIYAGTLRGGIFKSTDSGLNWAAVNTGLTDMDIQSIAIDPVLPTTIYVGTGGGIFKSTDGGLNWVAVNAGRAKLYYITISPVTPFTLYGSSVGGGVFKGVDIAATITNFTVVDNPTSGLDFTVNLSAPLPAGYTLAVNFDNQQGGWLLQTNAGGHIPLVIGLNGTTYTLNYVLNKPGLRSYQVGIFGPNGQLVGAYFPYKTCLTPTCLATIERTNNIGIPSTRGSQQFKHVDVASGNYYFSSTDMSVPGGKGPSFSLTRSYNSLGMKSVIQGTNQTNPNPLTINDYNVKPNPWTFAHDMQARFMDDKSETLLTTNTNRKIVLGPMEDGSLLYYFKDMDQKWYTLTAGNFKQLIQNANGSFTLYTQGDRIYQFADPAGVAKGRLNRIENRAGLALTYIYNASNVLTSVTDANNKSYTFTHVGSTLRVTDFTGRFVEYTFDANGMISQVRNMRGKFYRYTYGATGANIYRIATIRDPRNTATAQISLTSENIIGRVLSLVDGAGKLTGFQYGKANVGNPVKAEPATGITRPKVDGLNHNLVYILDKTRSKVKKRIDAKSYAQGVTIAASDIVTSHTYKTAASRNELADNSLVITTDDPNKNHTDIAYDSTIGGGRPHIISNAVGNAEQRKSTATYMTIPSQVNLKPVSTVQQSGVPAATKYQNFTATGKATTIIDPAGNSTARVYDPYNAILLISSTDPRLNTTHYTYDSHGYITLITDALGNQTKRTYDSLGRISQEEFPFNLPALTRITTYTYDDNGNVLTRTEKNADGSINYLTSNTYDANDNLTSTTDPKGFVTNYTYDNMNRKSSESYTVAGITYTRSYSYDPIGRLKSVANERGFTSQTHYTSRSQVKYKVDPFLKHTVTYSYDKNGNVTTVTDAENRTITTSYDALNRKTQVVDFYGNTQKWTYNPAGQVGSYENARGKIAHYSYDAVGNLIQVTDAYGGITKSTYDGNGNVLTVTDPNQHTTTYTYDALDRRTSTTLHDGRKWSYAYDANGNVLTETTPTGEKSVKTYDALSRMSSLTEYASDGTTVTRSISYTYDANGNVTSESNGSNTIAYTYDALNRITSVTDQYNQTISYGYDAAGNRTSLTYPGNKTISYVYDKNDRLKSLTDWLSKTTTYTRNRAGQVTQVLNGNGTKVSYTYDVAGRLTNLTNRDGTTANAIISSHAMTLDGAGNITQSTMNLPLLPTLPPSTGVMAYDTTNRLTSAAATSYASDVAGRTITEAKGTSTTTYNFDINDHITSITRAGATLSSYGYDLNNNRISQTQNGATTHYVIDPLASLPNVIAETDTLGTPQTYYIYGEGLVSQITAAGISHYYHYDPTGNTLALTDAAGAITDTFAYAPYGFTTSTGTTHNPFKFVGKYGVMDDGNGLHYMRARYYKENIKRFVSLDALHGDIMTPQKLNRYAYVLGNPVMGVDPSGYAKTAIEQFDGYYEERSDRLANYLANCSGFLECSAAYAQNADYAIEKSLSDTFIRSPVALTSNIHKDGVKALFSEDGFSVGMTLMPAGKVFGAIGKFKVMRRIKGINRLLESPIVKEGGRNAIKALKKARQWAVKELPVVEAKAANVNIGQQGIGIANNTWSIGTKLYNFFGGAN